MKVEATVLIDFGGADSAGIIATIELDDSKNIDSDGEVKSSFLPGDDIYFKTHFSFGVEVTDIIPTDGTVQSLGSLGYSEEEEVLFASRDPLSIDSHTLTYIPNSGVTVTYIGREGELIHTQDNIHRTVEYLSGISSVPFLAKFEYSYTGNSYVLHTPSVALNEGETYPIVIVAYIKTPEENANGCDSN